MPGDGRVVKVTAACALLARVPRSTSFTTRTGPHAGSTRAGAWVRQGSAGGAFRAFVPRPLPPPPLQIDSALQRRLELAGLALGRLDGIGRQLPSPDELLYSYVRKEAVLSSQIEGTQSSLSDLLLHENKAVFRDTVRPGPINERRSLAPGVPGRHPVRRRLRKRRGSD